MAKKKNKWSPEKINAAVEKTAELASSNPPIVLDALFPDGMRIGGVLALPITLSHYVMLEKIGSPFTKTSKLDLKKISNEELMKFCFIVTRSAAESRELLYEGQEVFEMAVFKFCENIKLQEMQSVGFALGKLLVDATSTMCEIAGEKKTPEIPQIVEQA